MNDLWYLKMSIKIFIYIFLHLLNFIHKLAAYKLLKLISMYGEREGDIIRNNKIHRMYKEILESLGDLANYVSKSYIYEKIRERTRLTTRTIQKILNHTKYQPLYEGLDY